MPPLFHRLTLCAVAAQVLVLPGCHLIDQTDFQPKAPVVVLRPVPDPETRPALVTIEYTTPTPAFRTALDAAIKAVETRRPGTVYDVVAVAGGMGDAQGARVHAADVMTAVEANGVIPARIQLGLTLEPGRTVQQVRVYLR